MTTTHLQRRLTLTTLLAVGTACAPDPTEEQVDRIYNGTDVTERNGSVVIRLKKTAKELEADPNKEYWYCTGALVEDDCVVTASHCVRGDVERLKKDGDVWHPDGANNWPAGGKNAGRPKPKEGETVSAISAVADRGNNNHQDLAVIKLKTALPGTTLAIGNTHPKASDKFNATVLGNGSTETDAYGHRSLDLQVFSEVEDPAAKGWSYLSMFDPNTWKDADDKKRKKIAPGDSGGPVLYDGKIIAVSSRGFTADAPENLRIGLAASVVAPEAQKWVNAKIKEICADEGGTSSGGEESSGGDEPTGDGGSGDEGTTTSTWGTTTTDDGSTTGGVPTTGYDDGPGSASGPGSTGGYDDDAGHGSTSGGYGDDAGYGSTSGGYPIDPTGYTTGYPIDPTTGYTTGHPIDPTTGYTTAHTTGYTTAHTTGLGDDFGDDWTASGPTPLDIGVATAWGSSTGGASSDGGGDTDGDDVPEPIDCSVQDVAIVEPEAVLFCEAPPAPGD